MAKYKRHPLSGGHDPLLGGHIRRSHFELGDGKTTSYQSVYALNSRAHDLAEAYVKPAPNKNFTSSFKVGLNDQPLHATEAQLMYKPIPPEAYKADPNLQANIRFIKGSHFDVGGDPREHGAGHFVTLKELSYKSPMAGQGFSSGFGAGGKLGVGDAGAIAGPNAGLNVEKLADLRKSHFQIGNEPEALRSQAQIAYTDKTAGMPHNQFKMRNLRESHFTLGNLGYDFVTEHMLKYRNPSLQ